MRHNKSRFAEMVMAALPPGSVRVTGAGDERPSATTNPGLFVFDEFSEMTPEQMKAILAWEPPSSAKFVMFQTNLPS